MEKFRCAWTLHNLRTRETGHFAETIRTENDMKRVRLGISH